MYIILQAAHYKNTDRAEGNTMFTIIINFFLLTSAILC